METILELANWDNFTIWCMISILVLIVWGICINDPGSDDTENIILTVICAIIALPVTIVFGIIILVMGIFVKRNARHK